MNYIKLSIIMTVLLAGYLVFLDIKIINKFYIKELSQSINEKYRKICTRYSNYDNLNNTNNDLGILPLGGLRYSKSTLWATCIKATAKLRTEGQQSGRSLAPQGIVAIGDFQLASSPRSLCKDKIFHKLVNKSSKREFLKKKPVNI